MHSDGTVIGKTLVDMQCSLAMLNAPSPTAQAPSHPSLQGLENITLSAKRQTLDKVRLARLAQRYNLDRVVRWRPRKVRISRTFTRQWELI